MEDWLMNLYNFNEWALMKLVQVVTGNKLTYNPELKKIILICIDDIKEENLDIIKKQIFNEFGIQTDIKTEKFDLKHAISGKFINTYEIAKKVEKEIQYDKSTAIMIITKNFLTPNRFLLSRIIHFLAPILGITYLIQGICILTTLNDKMPQRILKFVVIHEVGHLLGKHGYPLEWLRRQKKTRNES
ncbi:MAG: hypothetical protein EU551_01305 [Promethearchaeota archaeon]|nr:MAG: hypothetical protein EU551_01305 [Candidatus Lokiarchaeota archaeon]